MAKPLIVGTGLTGLVGSRIVELLQDDYHFFNIGRHIDVDITNKEQLENTLFPLEPYLLLHVAAKTDVDECENEKKLGRESEAWKVNVNGTEYLAGYCLKKSIPMIYISTDYVFGKGKGIYGELDVPSPVNFYGETKRQGENRVLALDHLGMICRISFPYRSSFPYKLDLVRAIMKRFDEGKDVSAITDQIIVPTFIDDIAYALAFLIKTGERGIFHIVGSESITPYDLALKIAQTFDYDVGHILPVKREEYFKGGAYRPYQTVLKNDKICSLGMRIPGVSECLKKINKQLGKISNI